MASRQREWQKRQQAAGNCIKCGLPRAPSRHGSLCPTHREKFNACLKARRARKKKREAALQNLTVVR